MTDEEIHRCIRTARDAIDTCGDLDTKDHERLGGALLGVALAHLTFSGVTLPEVVATVMRLWPKDGEVS